MLANLSQLMILERPKLLVRQALTYYGANARAFPCTDFGIYVAILKGLTVATGTTVEDRSFGLFYAAIAQTDDPGIRSC